MSSIFLGDMLDIRLLRLSPAQQVRIPAAPLDEIGIVERSDVGGRELFRGHQWIVRVLRFM
jgi:hypothetical protein